MVLKPESITMVATDGHRLAHVERPGEKFEGISGEMKTLVPKKAMNELRILLDATDSDHVEFAKDDSTLFSALASACLHHGSSPASSLTTKRCYQGQQQVHHSQSRRLLSAIQRVAQFADERSGAIRMKLEKNELKSPPVQPKPANPKTPSKLRTTAIWSPWASIPPTCSIS